MKKWTLFAIFFGGIAVASHAEPIKLCLALLVKEEEPILEECLKSVREIIDCVCICDTTSTNASQSILESFSKKTGIPGKVCHSEWQDYGTNQTLLAKEARKYLKELQFSLSHAYLLVLDPKMKLRIAPGFAKEKLVKDSYLLLEKASSYYNYDVHLLRASIPWENIGITHPCWSYSGLFECEKFPLLSIENQQNKSLKAERDIELLQQALRGDPSNANYLFSLAQSYRLMSQYEEAIDWYKARIDQGKESQESWFSKLMIGECYEKLSQWDRALYWYLEAYQHNPNRAESMQKISAHYLCEGKNALAYLFAKHGCSILAPYDQIVHDSSLFREYQLEEGLAVAAFYTPFKEDGYAATDHLILKRNVPEHVQDQAYKNMQFYAQNLKNAQFTPIVIDLPLIQEGSDARYRPMNPSIQKTPFGYNVVLRTVNYVQIGAKHFETLDPEGIYRTRNFLLNYTSDFQLLSQKEIIENVPRIPVVSRWWMEGIDDCRLFEMDRGWWFTCTTVDTNPTGQVQVSLCKLAEEAKGNTIEVEKLIPLKGPDPHRCEKNWLPFLLQGAPCAIYSYDPFILFELDPETGDCEILLREQPSHDFSKFRGSAGPIVFDGGYLLLVHEVIFLPDFQRCYVHRFLYLDRDFHVRQISSPFTFRHLGVEFCCGMTLDHTEANLILSVGIEDKEAYLCTVDLGTIRSLLHPLPTTYELPFE